MLRFTLRETANLLSGLIGAVLLAIALACLDTPAAWHGFAGFFTTYFQRLGRSAHFDFGMSAVSGQPAIAELAKRLPPTLLVIACGGMIALAVGGPLGIVFGAGPIRRAAAPLIQLVAATPVFCAALVLAYLAQRAFGWPVQTAGASMFAEPAFHFDPANPFVALHVLLLPALTAGAAGAAAVQLAVRRGSSLVAHEPYRRGLRRLGLSALEIERVYVVPQVAAVLAGSFGELMLALVAAAAIAEWMFNVPGAAVLFVKSVALGDWTMTALVLYAFAAIALIAEFLGRIGARAMSSTGVEP